MINEDRQKQILEQVLNHCTPITDRQQRQREHRLATESSEPQKHLTRAEVKKRLKAMTAETRKNPPPQTDEEWSLFFRLRSEYNMIIADQLDDEKETLEADNENLERERTEQRSVHVKIGKEHHRKPDTDATGKTIADFKKSFIDWYGKRKTARGAAVEVAKESGFKIDAIRITAKRKHWIT